MQGLYQLDAQGEDLLGRLWQFFTENEPDDSVRKQADEWVKGAWKNLAACDELIVNSAKKWGLARLSFVDKSILRLATYQLKFCQDIPAKVVINEAIEMAKKFSTEKSPAFVNGVLDNILQKINEGNQVEI
jgi:transcription antitermination factor NusB